MEIADSEREEGEIVDDEFEVVSDSSITSPVPLGKSVSATERLRSVSLSSISDSELIEVNSPRKKNGHCKPVVLKSSTPYTKPHHRRKRKRAHGGKKRVVAVVNISDSDEDEVFDNKTLQQLKEAVRINKSDDVHQKSLRTRLKPLIEPCSEKSHTEEEEDGGSGLNNNEEQEKSCDVTNDKELEELRLEALKSAVLKKHLERKKRKALENNKEKSETEKLEGGDINKENTVDNVIPANENAPKKEEAKKNEVAFEEDVDIMRALLLASISKKITEASKVTQKPPTVNKPPNNNNNNNPKPVIRNKVQNNYYISTNKIINTFKPIIPTVAPLIINLNNDSGSDMDIDDEDEENDQVAKSVTDFLNQQRAEVEAKTAHVQPPPPLPPPLPPAAPPLPPPPPPSAAPSVLDKSVLALLPFSQQIEYLRLKQQLQAKNVALQRKPVLNVSRVGKFSKNQGGGEGKLRNVRNKTVMRSKFSLVKQNAVKDRIRVVRANKFERGNANNLQKTLSDMQTQKDGRYLEIFKIVVCTLFKFSLSCLAKKKLRHDFYKRNFEKFYVLISSGSEKLLDFILNICKLDAPPSVINVSYFCNF